MRGQYFLRNSFHAATRNLLAKDKLDDCEKTQVICNYKVLCSAPQSKIGLRSSVDNGSEVRQLESSVHGWLHTANPSD